MDRAASHGERLAALETWSDQHEARCEERMKNINGLFEKIDGRFTKLERVGWTMAVSLIAFLAVQLGKALGLW